MIILGTATNFNDIIVGDDADDYIYGAGGNDLLLGGWGNDVLEGNDGDDTITPGFGIDTVYGGHFSGDSGIDTVSYFNYHTGVVVSLSGGYGYSKGQEFGDRDTLYGIENITGSNHWDDLYGNEVANQIEGRDGNDIIFGGGGNDTLLGGSGDDTVSGDAGSDYMDGGAGIDTLSYASNYPDLPNGVAGVTVNLNSGGALGATADGDSFTGFENITGSYGDDFLIGDDGANVLRGSDGRDVLVAFGGQDSLYGDHGDDTLYAGIDNGDYLYGGGGNDTLNGGAGRNILLGDTGDDKLVGNAGNDDLQGGQNKDTMTGGTGADRFQFFKLTAFNNTNASADLITDFSRAQGDKIHIAAFDANGSVAGIQKFTFIAGTGTYTGAGGELITRKVAADNSTWVFGDYNGDAVTDFRIKLTGQITLIATDFAFI